HPNSDHNITQMFTIGSSTADPNNLNNQETEVTAFVVPDADLSISVDDNPDPVFPDGDITYTVMVENSGPDPATNVSMQLVGNGGQTNFVSITTPAGWDCSAFPAAGTLI